jgi:hypothetical protein
MGYLGCATSEYSVEHQAMKTRTVINTPAVLIGPTETLSNSFFERAIRFFRAQPDPTPKASKIWNGLRLMLFTELEKALALGNVTWLKYYLGKLYEQGCLAGMDHSTPGIDPNFYAQELVALGYSTAAIRIWNEMQEGPTVIDFNELLTAVTKHIPFSMRWPGKCGGVPGMPFDGGLIPLKILEAAQLVVTAGRLIPNQPHHILEIGAGTGFNAYAFTQTYKGSHYYIVDLPVVCVIQAFLLSSALGEHSVSFFGEPKNEINISGLDWPKEPWFDLVLNRNSFPEIPLETAKNYLLRIGLELKPSGVFISVNHEAIAGGQVPVSEVVKSVPNLKCTGRSPWWPMAGHWEGYVLETFKTL